MTRERPGREKRVLAAVDDLLFRSRIQKAAEALGLRAEFPRRREALLKSLRSSPPDLLILDLDSPRFRPLELLEEAGEELAGVEVVGFVPHVRGDLAAAARRAGCGRVMARGAFAEQLPSVLSGDRGG
ncbi:response regulator [Rubrobacter xylanophilus]|nr:response regulator [Rubrobacter xylanophilus]